MKKHKSQLNAFNETAFGSQARTEAQATPELRNEGGTATAQSSAKQQTSYDPRLVTREHGNTGGKIMA